MKRIMPFLLLLFVTFSCSNSMLDSTDISIGVDLSELNLNYTSLDNLENNSKFKVSLYEVEKPEQVPVDYKSVDKSLYKMLASSYSSINDTKQASVVLNDIPVGINAFIIAEVFENDVDSSNVLYAGISKVFEVLPEKNIVDLELESCVIDEPVFTLEYKTQTEIVIYAQKNIKAGTLIPLPQTIDLDELGIKGVGEFLGFYTDSLFTGNPITSVVVDKDITLYAKFEIIYYSITYDIDGATWNSYYTPNSSYNVLNAANSYIPKGEDLEKVGYTFEGWYKDADYTEKITSLVGLFEDITLYAKWTPILYNITYKLNEGTWADDFNYEKSYTIESAADLKLPSSDKIIREEFVFDGWYDNPEYTGSPIDSLDGRTGDLTLYARWRNANQVATVVMTPDSSKTVSYGTEVKLSCTTENSVIYYKVGEKVNEYEEYTENSRIEITGETIIFAYAICGGMSDSEETKATYELHQYKLNFVTNGGTDVENYATYFDGATVYLDFLTTKDNMKFGGWFTTNDFSGNSIQSITFSQNLEFLNKSDNSITLYAQWQANQATITVTMPEYTDISELEEPRKNEDGTQITFTAPSEYTNYNWYVDGVKQTTTSPTTDSWTFDTTNLLGGIYTIMLVVEDSNGNKYSAEWQVEVTK